MKKRTSNGQKVFSPKFDFIFKKLFIENDKSNYLMDLLNTIYNYDKKDKKGQRIRRIEFIKNMDQKMTTALFNINPSSPTSGNKYSEKYFKKCNIFNRFSDPKLNENKSFKLDCICYVSKEDIENPSLELVSTGQSFILHLELRDITEYNGLNIINYINNQIKFQQILYFQQNMYELMSPQSPISPSSSKLSCFKKIPNIRSLFFLKNEEANSYPCLYHINPVIFDNTLQSGWISKDNSDFQFYESSTINDLTTVVQLSKINNDNSNIKDHCLKDWLNFINIGNSKSVLITEKSSINAELFQDNVVKELVSYLIDISNNKSITNELLSTKGILHNMKIIEEKAKIESILRMLLVLTEDGLMSFDIAKNKAIKMYPKYIDFIDDLTEEELAHQKKLLDENNNTFSNLEGSTEFMSESDDDSENEWEIVNINTNTATTTTTNNNNNNSNNNITSAKMEEINNTSEKTDENNQIKKSSSIKLIIDNVKSTFSSNKTNDVRKEEDNDNTENKQEEEEGEEGEEEKKNNENNNFHPSMERQIYGMGGFNIKDESIQMVGSLNESMYESKSDILIDEKSDIMSDTKSNINSESDSETGENNHNHSQLKNSVMNRVKLIEESIYKEKDDSKEDEYKSSSQNINMSGSLVKNKKKQDDEVVNVQKDNELASNMNNDSLINKNNNDLNVNEYEVNEEGMSGEEIALISELSSDTEDEEDFSYNDKMKYNEMNLRPVITYEPLKSADDDDNMNYKDMENNRKLNNEKSNNKKMNKNKKEVEYEEDDDEEEEEEEEEEVEVEVDEHGNEIIKNNDSVGNRSGRVIKQEIDEDGNIVQYEEEVVEVEVDEDGNEIEYEEEEIEVEVDEDGNEIEYEEEEVEVEVDENGNEIVPQSNQHQHQHQHQHHSSSTSSPTKALTQKKPALQEKSTFKPTTASVELPQSNKRQSLKDRENINSSNQSIQRNSVSNSRKK